MTDNKEQMEGKEREDQETHHLVPIDSFCGPMYELSAEETGFQQAFLDTLRHQGEGLLTRYLYYDPSKEDGAQERLKISGLLGAGAWDANNRNNPVYGLATGDLSALGFAIECGLVSKLPENMLLTEYGAGGVETAGKHATDRIWCRRRGRRDKAR